MSSHPMMVVLERKLMRCIDDKAREIEPLKERITVLEKAISDYQTTMSKIELELLRAIDAGFESDIDLPEMVILTKEEYEDLKEELEHYRNLAENTPDI